MKILMMLALSMFPFLGFGQDMDSVRVAGEVDSLIKIVQNLTNQDEFEKAFNILGYTEGVAEKKFGEQSEHYVRCRVARGMVNYFAGHDKEAEDILLAIREIQEKSTGKERPVYAKILNNLAIIYQDKGDVEDALELYLEALRIRERTLGREHPDYAASINNLATIYSNKGQYDKALSMHFENLTLKEKLLGKNHPDYATTLQNIGTIYNRMGEYDKALWHHSRAMEIVSSNFGEESSKYANSLRYLASTYTGQGDYSSAIELYLKSKTIIERKIGRENRDFAQILNNIAAVYIYMKEYGKAMSVLSEALELNEKIFSKMHISYAHVLGNIGLVYKRNGDYKKSLTTLQEVEVIIDKTLGKESKDYMELLTNIGITYELNDDFDNALNCYIKSLSIAEKLFGSNHSEVAKSYHSIASGYLSQGKVKESELYLLKSNLLSKTLIRKSATYLTEEEMHKYEATLDERFHNLLQSNREHLSDSLTCAAYNNTLFLNNSLLFNAVAREKGIAQADSSTRAIHSEWKSCHFQLGGLYSQPIANRDSARVAYLEEQANKYEKELVRRSPDFAETQKEVFWQDVKSQLRPKEAAIEFVNFRCYNKYNLDSTIYAALVLLPNAPVPIFIPLCQEADLLAVLDQPQGYKQGYFDRLYRGIKPKAKAKIEGLHQLLWQPLDTLLAGTKRIYYAPSGILHRINLVAISTDQGESIGSKYELVQLGSTRQLVTKNSQAFTNKDAVVLGGINYEAESAVPQSLFDSLATGDELVLGSTPNFSDLTRNLRGGEWNYLEGTEKEATEIAKLLKNKGFKAKKLNGHAATEEVFKAIGHAGPSPQVLHIATHGFFFPDANASSLSGGWGEAVFRQSDNPMIRAGLILAGANPVWKGEPTLAGKEDGILTAYEISQMNLSNTELVVLSACETGLGDIQGSEGVYGLQRAFKIAGAKHLIMSLWDVPDAETAEFMTHFYKEWLGGKDINSAFRNSQQAMRETYPNEPFLWAGFVLVE